MPRTGTMSASMKQGGNLATLGLIEYQDASPEVRAVYDDIMATRKTDWINNFWKALAHDPATLRRTWQSVKEIMAPGALDALTKEMIYVAVSATNQCGYCIASHTAAARKAGMTDAMLAEVDGRGGHGERNQSPGERISGGDRREIPERVEEVNNGHGYRKNSGFHHALARCRIGTRKARFQSLLQVKHRQEVNR